MTMKRYKEKELRCNIRAAALSTVALIAILTAQLIAKEFDFVFFMTIAVLIFAIVVLVYYLRQHHKLKTKVD